MANHDTSFQERATRIAGQRNCRSEELQEREHICLDFQQDFVDTECCGQQRNVAAID